MSEKEFDLQNSSNNKIICVVGPTASGKSALAVDIALHFGGEVISCDSMQVYKNMNIGTAKTTESEMKGVAHHLIDILDINQKFSVSDYVRLASDCVSDVQNRGKLPVFCGGTGLYIDSFIKGIEFGEYQVDPDLAKKYQEIVSTSGFESLHNLLKSVDPESAEKIQPENVKRVMRALEVSESTGIPMSRWNRLQLEKAVKRDALYIGLTFENRSVLYDRINKRVDDMMRAGLLEEAYGLVQSGIESSPTAGQAIGYKEFYPYFKGEAQLDECVERLKINSRHYAKRQITWFSANKEIMTIAVDSMTKEDVCRRAFEMCERYLDKERQEK